MDELVFWSNDKLVFIIWYWYVVKFYQYWISFSLWKIEYSEKDIFTLHVDYHIILIVTTSCVYLTIKIKDH